MEVGNRDKVGLKRKADQTHLTILQYIFTGGGGDLVVFKVRVK